MSSKGKGQAGNRKTANGRILVDMDPSQIYFTHARVRPVFTGCRKLIMETYQEIVDGVTKVTDIPYITVIENQEAVPTLSNAKPSSSINKGRKKGRRGDISSDEEDDVYDQQASKGRGGKNKKGKNNGSAPTQASATSTFYFSLNNRRLFLFKLLKDEGIIDTIPVQVKPALERERVKYTRTRCVLQAKMMPRRENDVAEEDEVDDGDGDGDDETTREDGDGDED